MKPERPNYRDLVLMVDIMCACIETRILPTVASPMHRQAREFVRLSGCAPKRVRIRLPKKTKLKT